MNKGDVDTIETPGTPDGTAADRAVDIGLRLLGGTEQMPDLTAVVGRAAEDMPGSKPSAARSLGWLAAAAVVLLGVSVIFAVASIRSPGDSEDSASHRSAGRQDPVRQKAGPPPSGQRPLEPHQPVAPDDPRVVTSLENVAALGESIDMVYALTPSVEVLSALAQHQALRRLVVVGIVGRQRWAMTAEHFEVLGSCSQLESLGLTMVLALEPQWLDSLQALPMLQEFHWVTSGEFLDEHALAVTRWPALQRLVVAGKSFLSVDGVAAFAKRAGGLREFTLVGYTGLPSDGYGALGAMKGLRTLNIGSNHQDHRIYDLRNDRLFRLFTAPQIPGKVLLVVGSELRREAVDGFDDSVLEALSQIEGLVELSLAGRPVSDAGLRHLGQIEGLQSLNLSGCLGITDAGLAHLPPTLRTLELAECFELGGDFPKTFTALKKLVLTDSHRASGELLARLPVTMRHLDLSRCPGIDAEGLPRIASMAALEHLTLSEHRWVDDDTCRVLGRLTELRQLDLGRSVGEPHSKNQQLVFHPERGVVSAAGLAALNSLQKLGHLILSGHEPLPAAALAGLKIPTLRFLELRRTGIDFDEALPSIDALQRATPFSIEWWKPGK